MLTLGFIKREKIAMDKLKDTIENTNFGILNDINKLFESKDEGFKNKSLNRFFIQNGFIYDTKSKSFQYSVYNKSIDKIIDIDVFEHEIMFQCGRCTYRSLIEFPSNYSEEKARTKMVDLLNGMAENFMEMLKEYINTYGSVSNGDDSDE